MRPPYDNRAAQYDTIVAEPIAAALGAEIRINDPYSLQTAPVAVLTDIESALYAHGMLVFRGQPITHARHEQFTQFFGEFGDDAFTNGVDGHPDIQPVIREVGFHPPVIFGGDWHTDSAFLERPPSVSMLRSVEVPPFGGDTHWASTRLAYRSLSETMQRMLDPLVGLYSQMPTRRAFDIAAEHPGRPTDIRPIENDLLTATPHPLVRVHPMTEDRALYADDHYLIGIQGMTRTESEPLVRFLAQHVADPRFCGRTRWEPDMLVVWDNRLVIHLAIDDVDDDHRREMYRSTVRGEVPISVQDSQRNGS